MNKKRLLRGLCVSLSFFSALFLTLELIATSSSDYKSMVDGVFGVNNSAAGGGGQLLISSQANMKVQQNFILTGNK